MNWKVILLLLLVTLGLGAFLMFQDKPEVEKQTRTVQDLERVLPYTLDEVQRVTVIFQDTTFVIVRDGSQWRMQQPAGSGMADSMVVNHLIRALSDAPFVQEIPVGELDLDAVMLTNPVLVISAYNQAGDSTRLEFGTLNPTTDNIYVHRKGEGRVVLANRLLGPMMTVSSFLLHGKSLTGIDPYNAVDVRIESGGREMFHAWRRETPGRWWIDNSGDSLWADQYRMEIRLAEFYNDQVREFHETDEFSVSETGLNQPLRIMTVASVSGDTTVVELGSTVRDTVYMRWATSTLYPGHLLLVDSWLIERFDMFTPDSMRCLQLADIVPSEVNFISLSSPLDSLVLFAVNDTLWNIVEPQKAKAKFLQVDQLLRHVDTVAAKQVIPPGKNRGYETPQARLMLKHGDTLLADLVFGDYSGENIYVRDNKRNLDFLASSAEVAPLNITFKDLADVPVRHVVE